MKKLYRPDWNCGRYHISQNRSYALLYNLIEGMAYIFEDESADIVGQVLKHKRNTEIDISLLRKAAGSDYTEEEVLAFSDQLVDVGLLTEGILPEYTVAKNRYEVGNARKKQFMEVEKTIQKNCLLCRLAPKMSL